MFFTLIFRKIEFISLKNKIQGIQIYRSIQYLLKVIMYEFFLVNYQILNSIQLLFF